LEKFSLGNVGIGSRQRVTLGSPPRLSLGIAHAADAAALRNGCPAAADLPSIT
jgi:hypothetical protein